MRAMASVNHKQANTAVHSVIICFIVLAWVARERKCKTINSRYSLVVTDLTTNLSLNGLSTGDRTGTPVFRKVFILLYILLVLRGQSSISWAGYMALEMASVGYDIQTCNFPNVLKLILADFHCAGNMCSCRPQLAQFQSWEVAADM